MKNNTTVTARQDIRLARTFRVYDCFHDDFVISAEVDAAFARITLAAARRDSYANVVVANALAS